MLIRTRTATRTSSTSASACASASHMQIRRAFTFSLLLSLSLLLSSVSTVMADTDTLADHHLHLRSSHHEHHPASDAGMTSASHLLQADAKADGASDLTCEKDEDSGGVEGQAVKAGMHGDNQNDEDDAVVLQEEKSDREMVSACERACL
jgi:hypothetical protein